MSKKEKDSGFLSVIVGSLLTFLFSNVFLLVYSLFKSRSKKVKNSLKEAHARIHWDCAFLCAIL